MLTAMLSQTGINYPAKRDKEQNQMTKSLQFYKEMKIIFYPHHELSILV